MTPTTMADPFANVNLLTLINAMILLVVVLLLWGGHFFPWHIVPILVERDGKRELKRMVAYTYGVGCIWLGAVAYAIAKQVAGLAPLLSLGDLTSLIIAAALGTALPRLVKRVRDMQVTLSEARNVSIR